VLAVRGAQLSNYGGVSLNVSYDRASIDVDPMNLPRMQQIKQWYQAKAAQGTVVTESLTRREGVNMGALPSSSIQEMT